MRGGTDGGGVGGGRDRDGDELSRWEDNLAHVNLGAYNNAPLAYATVSEHLHPVMSMIGDHRGWSEREI